MSRLCRHPTSLRAGLIALVAGFLTGCGALFHGDAIRLCRSLTPIFNGPTDRIDIRRTDASRTVHGLLVLIAYTVPREDAPADRRAVSCIFREDGPGGRLDLTNLATEDGPVGDVRLYFIKRLWIDKGHAAISDPSPVTFGPVVPEISRSLAITLQALVASAGGIAIYALLAAAYALIYGLIGRVHLAFGELTILAGYGAFLGYWITGGAMSALAGVIGALVIGVATAIIHGGALGRLIFERLATRPGQHILIATLGLSIAWSEAMRLSQGTGSRWLSPLSSGPIAIARADDYLVTVTFMGLAVPIVAAAALWTSRHLLHATTFGRAWRAYADDPVAAALCGVGGRRIIGAAMLLASLLTGLAGVLMLAFWGGVGHAGGLTMGLKALIAAVVGGIGSVRAAVLGALVIGLGETAWSHLVSVDSRDLALYVGLAVVLALKPEGLFSTR